ncbi:MAG: hypothetical protein Sylvanvirus1_33 [Sylvanvirus sp.]|uniref:Uncharacterized protein n=1 Tax=Sylvanvirus sp. TaxID=2487774 RepID=A0A3G5AGX1_9VIRU|nr:MAG: hypothetical protein Sylvanvirus1_33 [Sylvanvirus sp.]
MSIQLQSSFSPVVFESFDYAMDNDSDSDQYDEKIGMSQHICSTNTTLDDCGVEELSVLRDIQDTPIPEIGRLDVLSFVKIENVSTDVMTDILHKNMEHTDDCTDDINCIEENIREIQYQEPYITDSNIQIQIRNILKEQSSNLSSLQTMKKNFTESYKSRSVQVAAHICTVFDMTKFRTQSWVIQSPFEQVDTIRLLILHPLKVLTSLSSSPISSDSMNPSNSLNYSSNLTHHIFVHGADIAGLVERKSNISRLLGQFKTPSEKVLGSISIKNNFPGGQVANFLTFLGLEKFLSTSKVNTANEAVKHWLIAFVRVCEKLKSRLENKLDVPYSVDNTDIDLTVSNFKFTFNCVS